MLSSASSLTAQKRPVWAVELLIKVWMYLNVPFLSKKLGMIVPVAVKAIFTVLRAYLNFFILFYSKTIII